jgi:hypothetical protein
MLLGLRTAIYPVSDLAVAKRWYEQVIGAAPYFDEPFYGGFAVGGFELGLVPGGVAGTGGPQALWGVADARAAFERLLALGGQGDRGRQRGRRRHHGGRRRGSIRQSARHHRESELQRSGRALAQHPTLHRQFRLPDMENCLHG